MAKGPAWNDVHRANPGAVRDALTEQDIPFDDAPLAQPNGNGHAYFTEEELPDHSQAPLAKLNVGDSHTIEGQRLEVNESLTRHQRELKSLASTI